MSESLLQLGGAPPSKQYKNVPICTSSFFSGLFTQRSPFGTPDSRYYAKILGGRTDILIAGLNTELTNYGTLIRRPGMNRYSSANLGSSPLTFYSFHQLNNTINPIQIIADTATNVSALTPTSNTNILTKTMGAGQSYFQGIGSTLYIGDGVDLQAWSGAGATRNWGITISNTADTTGPNSVGTGANVSVSGSSAAWANPGNITANDGSFATAVLPPPTGGSVTITNSPTVAGQTGASRVWNNVNNIKVSDGVFATVNVINGQTSNLLQASGYNFGVPSTATVNGITVTVLKGSTPTTDVVDGTVQLLKAGTGTGSNKANGTVWGTVPTAVYGSSSDLWGTTWTPADINNPSFGIQISAHELDNPGGDTPQIDFISIAVTYTVPTGTTSVSDLLEATNFGFGLSLVNTISGILVEIKGIQTSNPAGSDIIVSILKNGSQVGTAKVTQLNGTNSFITLGSSSDLWGSTFSPGDINSSTFGVSVQGSNSGSATATWNVDFVRITTFGTGGPSISITGSGSFGAFSSTGYAYVYAYGNSNSGQVSNPTPPSANTGSFGGVISTSVLAAAGTGYAPNDTGIVAAGNFNATYKVLTVSGGNVLTYSITSAGTGYSILNGAGNNVSTARSGTQPGAGLGFTINVTAVTGAASVQLSVVASTDPQVNQIRVFRTKDGGSTFFELPSSPYPNTTTTITDSSADSSLQTLSFFEFSPWLGNSPPPAGLVKMTYHLNRVWGVVGNNVYFSALLGDDITLGVGAESWPPVNVFVFPTNVNRLMPIASGLLVFTTDDIYLISGTTRTNLFSQLFQQGVGLLSWNALDVEGNQIFLYTSDRQFISFTAAGPIETGFPIGVDLQTNYNPNNVYVAALINGTQDKAVFINDGVSNWYRCNWNQPPEGGPAWSPQATIVNGATCVVSVETTPGTHQLLIGQSNGTVLVRNYNVFSDNGVTYPASATIGSLVLAKPGQLALLDSIVIELQKTGSVPSVALLLDEIGGTFENLLNAVDDPPNLPPASSTLLSKRWYLSQGKTSSFCRHIQLQISWPSEAAKNEILTVTEIGSLVQEK